MDHAKAFEKIRKQLDRLEADLTRNETTPEAEPETTFDFGFGPVKAARHTNPDGTAGGWVADTANVESAAWVSGNARVSGNAQVFGTARVSDTLTEGTHT